jgi:hypothetical protein
MAATGVERTPRTLGSTRRTPSASEKHVYRQNSRARSRPSVRLQLYVTPVFCLKSFLSVGPVRRSRTAQTSTTMRIKRRARNGRSDAPIRVVHTRIPRGYTPQKHDDRSDDVGPQRSPSNARLPYRRQRQRRQPAPTDRHQQCAGTRRHDSTRISSTIIPQLAKAEKQKRSPSPCKARRTRAFVNQVTRFTKRQAQWLSFRPG